MKILLCDDDLEILEILDFLLRDYFSMEIELIKFDSGKNALEYLKHNSVDLILCDHRMPNGNGDEVLKYLMKENKAIPFVLVSSELKDFYIQNKIFHYVQKPFLSKGIEELSLKFNPNSNEKSNSGYVPISLSLLKEMGKAPADIYIKISELKFVKYINENDLFTNFEENKFKSKSLTELYLKKPINQSGLNEIFHTLISKIMEKNNISLTSKMTSVHYQLRNLMIFSKMSEDLANLTKNTVEQTTHLISKNNTLNNFWKELNSESDYPSELYTLHSMLASMIVKKLPWSSESCFFKLTMAAFLQDISLNSEKLMRFVDYEEFLLEEKNLSDEEIRLFNEHTLNSKEYMSYFKNLSADIDNLILEHHEMPNGNGFPKKLNAKSIRPLSCVFILSGILAKFILVDKENFDKENFIKYMIQKGFDQGNFKEVFLIIKSL